MEEDVDDVDSLETEVECGQIPTVSLVAQDESLQPTTHPTTHNKTRVEV